MRQICLTEVDKFIYNKEIRPFLPQRIFDAHTHLLKNEFHPDLEKIMPLVKDPLLGNVDMAHLQRWWGALFPDSQTDGLAMGFPTKGCDIKAVNNFLAESINGNNRFSILTSPQISADDLESEIVRLKPAGLKPYMTFVKISDPNSASIIQMIPEEQIALADKYNMAITLHVAKPRGMADTENMEQISRLVRQYPKCNFILAHCGRCFITPNMEDALAKLPIAENLWIDTSAVCDIGVFINLFSKYDLKKVLFGTDLVTAAGFRGVYHRLGMNWAMLTTEMIASIYGNEIKATFAAYENLAALFNAAKFCKLSETDIQNIFYNNAKGLFNLDSVM